jgi:hypothetical protein
MRPPPIDQLLCFGPVIVWYPRLRCCVNESREAFVPDM